MTDQAALVQVVDDDRAFRTAISRVLRAAGYDVQEYESAGDYLLRGEALSADCLLLDLRMPGPSGLDLQNSLSRQDRSVPVVFLTAHGDIPTSVHAMKAGAADFLTKPVKREPLLAAVRAAVERTAGRRQEDDDLRELRKRFDGLSSRERQVLEHVVSGRLNKQIAAQMGISERTVKAHRAHCLVKMGVHSIAELVRAADRLLPRIEPRLAVRA